MQQGLKEARAPWDMLGPQPGSSKETFVKQRWREGSQRHANAGGKIPPERYALWRREGERYFFAPKNPRGYWFYIDNGMSDFYARAHEPASQIPDWARDPAFR